VIRRRVVVHGFVQGVFFRDSLRRLAERNGVAGWVRNNRDGTVEAAVEGDPESVQRIIDYCRSGPRGAHVDRVDVYEEEAEGASGFSVR
jgi:acylphosphatase